MRNSYICDISRYGCGVHLYACMFSLWVHVCADTGECVHSCMLRPEVEIEFLWLLSTLYIRAWSLTGTKHLPIWLIQFGSCILCLCPSRLWLEEVTTITRHLTRARYLHLSTLPTKSPPTFFLISESFFIYYKTSCFLNDCLKCLKSHVTGNNSSLYH